MRGARPAAPGRTTRSPRRRSYTTRCCSKSSPAPLVGEQIAWYRRKIGEYESLLAAAELAPGWSGPELTLRSGIDYYRKMIEMIEGMAGEQDR